MKKVDIPSEDLLPIVGDGAIASPDADGRMFAVLILDTRNHYSFTELLRVHEYLAPGDVEFAWGGTKRSNDEVLLLLRFSRPIEVQVALIFSIETQGGLVDLMLSSKGVYLQSGEPGDRLAATMDKPRMMVELPSTGFEEDWEAMYLERMAQVIRRRARISKRDATSAAREFIERMRELGRSRMSS